MKYHKEVSGLLMLPWRPSSSRVLRKTPAAAKCNRQKTPSWAWGAAATSTARTATPTPTGGLPSQCPKVRLPVYRAPTRWRRPRPRYCLR